MKLYAISDLHVSSGQNLEHLDAVQSRPEDWLIVAGDVCEHPEHFARALEILVDRFARVIWTPGNHELWTANGQPNAPRGVAKYDTMVRVARTHGVVTPEDPYQRWEGEGQACVLVPLFLLYDYSFRPDHIAVEQIVEWSAEEGAVCADEILLSPDPFDGRAAWCHERLRLTERRIAEEIPPDLPTVLINHYPLREELVYIPRIPRFAPWFGTRATRDWHRRYNAIVCISGHLHTRRTDWIDGTRFEEVSFGYPRHWDRTKGINNYLRAILPGPPPPPGGHLMAYPPPAYLG